MTTTDGKMSGTVRRIIAAAPAWATVMLDPLVQVRVLEAQRQEVLYATIRGATGASREDVQSLLDDGWSLKAVEMYAKQQGKLPSTTPKTLDNITPTEED